MKNIKLLILALLSVFFFSCEEDVDIAESYITYLPKFEVEGSDYIELTCEEDFQDPGATAFEGGEPIDVTTEVSGLYFGESTITTPDKYLINYSATNVDGIPGAATREVYKKPCSGDLVNDISGVYTSTVNRTGVGPGFFEGVGPVLITKGEDNVYRLSHAIGGYYDYGTQYGPDYAGTGMTVIANDIPSNSFEFPDVIGVGLFGGELSMTSFKVDPATETITFRTEWSFGYNFDVTLTKTN